MSKKNGHDDSEDPKVTRFPDARERKEIEHRLRAANDPAKPSEPILNMPPAVKWLCAILILIQIPIELMKLAPDDWQLLGVVEWIYENFGFSSLRYTGDAPFGWQGLVAPVSYIMLHGNFLHLGLNIAMLAAFGAGLEKAIGGKRMLALFFLTGILGAFTHTAIYLLLTALGQGALFPHADAPLIGASGGISGVVGAVLVMAKDKGLLADFMNGRITIPVIAILVSIFFFGFFGMPGAGGQIAWTAHVGGFVAGLLLYRPIVRSKIFS